MKIIAAKYLIPKGFAGITLYPFIIVNDKRAMQNKTLLNHEKIHLRQQAEMLVLPFYIWYSIEYLIRLIQHRNRQTAYRNISFEREAYHNESSNTFLSNRPFWNFLKFILK